LELKLRLPPDAQSLRLVRAEMRSLLDDHGFAAAGREAVLLGLDEVLTNACMHAARAEPRDPIELTVTLFADRLALEVCDRGGGVAAPANGTASLPEEESESGRGLFLIQRTMDEVSFEPRNGGGTRVRLVKRR